MVVMRLTWEGHMTSILQSRQAKLYTVANMYVLKHEDREVGSVLSKRGDIREVTGFYGCWITSSVFSYT